MKLQSAMEYLMTYSWAILVLAVVLGALYALGLFSPGSFVNTQCILPAGLACTNVYMLSNGLVYLNLLQVTQQPINVTYIGCNANNTVAHMYPANIGINIGTNQIRLQIGANYTFLVQCWSGNSQYASQPGGFFAGYLFVNYTELTTGFPHTAAGQLTAKIT
jgi:hypothetical protein